MNLTVLSAPAGLAGKVPAGRRLDRCTKDIVRGAAREGCIVFAVSLRRRVLCGGPAVSLLYEGAMI